jgi:MFS family permease
MSERTITAALIAIILGPFFGYLVATSGYAAYYVLPFACLFCPFVVSLIADQKIILLALMPNPLLILTWMIVVKMEHPDDKHFGIQTVSAIFLFAIPALLVSAPIHFARRFLQKKRRATR